MRALDQIDRALLAFLKQDARASVTEIAATLNISRATVNSHMAALRADGVIRRFTIEVSETADQDLIHAVSLMVVDPSKADRVHRALNRMNQITDIYSTNGKWDIVAHSQTLNLSNFDALLYKIGQINGVSNVETCLLLSRIQ